MLVVQALFFKALDTYTGICFRSTWGLFNKVTWWSRDFGHEIRRWLGPQGITSQLSFQNFFLLGEIGSGIFLKSPDAINSDRVFFNVKFRTWASPSPPQRFLKIERRNWMTPLKKYDNSYQIRSNILSINSIAENKKLKIMEMKYEAIFLDYSADFFEDRKF